MSFSAIAKAVRDTEAEFRRMKPQSDEDFTYKEHGLRALAILAALADFDCRLLSGGSDPEPSFESSLPSTRRLKGKNKSK